MTEKIGIVNTLLLCFLFTIALGYCQGHFNGDYAQCSYDYGYTDPNCTLFRFDNCFWQECTSWVQCGNDTCCDSYVTLNNSNWDFCMNHCCGKSYNFDQSSLQQCEDDLQAISRLIFIIIMSVLGLVLLIVVIIIATIKCKGKMESCCKGFRECLEGACEALWNVLTCKCLRNLKKYQDPSCYHTQPDEAFKIWEQDSSYNPKVNEICTICFQPAPSLLLQSCDHVFHRECIIASIQKKRECPICGSPVGDIVKAYCQGCFKKSYTTSLKNDRQMLRLQKQLCQKCCLNNQK